MAKVVLSNAGNSRRCLGWPKRRELWFSGQAFM